MAEKREYSHVDPTEDNPLGIGFVATKTYSSWRRRTVIIEGYEFTNDRGAEFPDRKIGMNSPFPSRIDFQP